MRRERNPMATDAVRRSVDHAADPLLEAPRAVLDRLRTLVGDGPDRHADGFLEPPTAPVPVIEPATAAPLAHGTVEPLAVDRAFAFVDISGFTAYCDRHGERAAVGVLTLFRSVTREVVGRRGVRVAKWLGDGVMLVGTAPGPLVAAVVELECRVRATGLETHAGVAWGSVLLFEGDDYVGRTVNLAARLADAAGPGEVLGAGLTGALPEWVERKGLVTVQVAGMGRISDVASLGAVADVERTLLDGASAA